MPIVSTRSLLSQKDSFYGRNAPYRRSRARKRGKQAPAPVPLDSCPTIGPRRSRALSITGASGGKAPEPAPVVFRWHLVAKNLHLAVLVLIPNSSGNGVSPSVRCLK